jgi:HD-GYP domain-containing protein (c-di-GMP phosphodiesterase class II)
LATFPGTGQREIESWLKTHTSLGAQFAERVGLGAGAAEAILQGYEQWDGKGPRHLRGDQIPLPARLVSLSGIVEVIARRHGVTLAESVVRKHAGKLFDPGLAEVFVQNSGSLLDGGAGTPTWEQVLDAEPRLARRVAGAELDEVLEAMADLVDLKSPYLAGHSRGVANLAAEAARIAGLPEAERVTLRRAGLLHDLGRLGVSNAIWDKPGPLSDVERERAHQHPYLTDKMLARIPALARSREIAARHHERLDGSGYPRGMTAASLTPADRLLAAADVYHAMTEPRPHRPALAADEAAAQLRSRFVPVASTVTPWGRSFGPPDIGHPRAARVRRASRLVRSRCSHCSPAATRPKRSPVVSGSPRRRRRTTSSTCTRSLVWAAVRPRRCSRPSTAWSVALASPIVPLAAADEYCRPGGPAL